MSVLIESFAQAWEPEDTRPATEWGAEFVKVPGSARASTFDPNATPWLIDPINAIPDNRIKEIVLLMPTGAGKTTVFDVAIPRAIKTDPGSFLLTMQNDEEANGYWEERLLPILEGVPDVRGMLDSLPRSKRKRGFISFPHMTLYCSSAKWKALQRKSVRYVGMDEVWMVPHGFVAEARARTHDRWNQRILLASQGGTRFIEHNGEVVLTELEEAWRWSNQNEFSMKCPECGHVQKWANSSLIYESGESANGELDERAILESARYRCEGRCKTEFEDNINIRRELAESSIYVPHNDKALPRHVGYHVNGLALYYVPWGERALKWKRANIAKKTGDYEPLRVHIQKVFAEFWDEHEHRFSGFKSDAPASDYVIIENEEKYPGIKAGFPWDEEESRFMAADYQELDGKYFVAGAAAFSADGKSRIIWAGRVNTAEELRAKQVELGISGRRVGIDCADNTPDVNSFCRKYDWLELLGSDRENWQHTDRKTGRSFLLPWSPPGRVAGVKDGCWRASWSNSYFHDLHARRLQGPATFYGVPGDIEDFAAYIDPQSQKPTGFWPQMRANHKIFKENKSTGKKTAEWIRIGKRADHYRDMRCMLLVMAGIGGCLGEVYTGN